MRKITKKAIEAFNKNQDFSLSNTKVVTFADVTELRLFNHLIAEKHLASHTLRITNAGWASNTTKERLNGLEGVSISQKQNIWYLNGKEWDGNWITIN